VTHRPTAARIPLVLAAAAPLLALPGCGATGDAPVTVLTPELRPWLEVEPPVVTRDDRRRLAIEVGVRNRAAREQLLEYRVLFQDRAGRDREPAMAWTMVGTGPPDTVVVLAARASDAEAGRCRVEIRRAR
jgi:hypothetical protein